MFQIIYTVSTIYLIIFCIIAGYLLIVTLLNRLYKQKIRQHPSKHSGAMVSVLIPVRNEENTIGNCLDSLVKQTYDNLEIIVLDDGSTDFTWDILSRYRQRYSRVKILKGKAKPESWKGKTFAVKQLAAAAEGEYLYMTDADTLHSREAVAWAVERLEERGLDAFSAMPRQEMRSIAEKIIIPTVIIPLLFLPLHLINSGRIKSLAFGIGQFFMFRRDVFFETGGMKPVRHRITEDIALANRTKKLGYRYQFLNSFGHIRCRMYGGFREAIAGFAKNFYEFAAISPALASFIIALIAMLFLAPPFVALASLFISIFSATLVTNLFLFIPVSVFILAWGINLANNDFPVYTAVLYPVFVLMFIVQAGLAVYRNIAGSRPSWKSRAVE